ncbi:pentapeptide repeat-containing protein [Amycolatopsis sp. H6(2020)]|nr:pentapeptide repeat-containing protein [Amycolatopsis sp. H6(2020)]
MMVLVAVGSAWLLLGRGTTRDQLDAIRTAGTLGICLGGMVGLWLAVRRQRSTELDLLQKYEAHELAVRTMDHTEHDARERRLTELYLKAIEQLGSDKAAVRIGGIHALERVAQDNPNLRQTVVDVVCTYLRSPYNPPGQSGSRRLGVRRPLLASTSARGMSTSISRGSAPMTPLPNEVDDAAWQEKEVRLTAQRLLQRHLAPDFGHLPASTFWKGIDLDLTGATLVDFDLRGCRVGNADFTRARFIGYARFTTTRFTGHSGFAGAQFFDGAEFSGAQFSNDAWFNGARLAGDSSFRWAKFTRVTWLNSAQFGGTVDFDEAEFGDQAWFDGCKFAGKVRFSKANFVGLVRFVGAEFVNDTSFSNATFRKEVEFKRTRFVGDADFDDATFTGDAWFGSVRFVRNALFSNVQFCGDVGFGDVEFPPFTLFQGVKFTGGTWIDATGFYDRIPDSLAKFM